QLDGSWFDDGFKGAMLELLCSIEEDREPFNSAQNNLATLASVYAIIKSADNGNSVEVGENRQLGENCQPRASE
ncbi:MAG: gfo/Idh/MocA family oxidoreductase, partial [Opitutales bacterium]|nr:gfo/Idh/MocA family oxidoreductase [Opitutales bacterium]